MLPGLRDAWLARSYEFPEESKRILRYRRVERVESSLLCRVIPIHTKQVRVSSAGLTRVGAILAIE